MDGDRQAASLAVPGGVPMKVTAPASGFKAGAGPTNAHRRTPGSTGATPLTEETRYAD
jgi:hypothetical protein